MSFKSAVTVTAMSLLEREFSMWIGSGLCVSTRVRNVSVWRLWCDVYLFMQECVKQKIYLCHVSITSASATVISLTPPYTKAAHMLTLV